MSICNPATNLEDPQMRVTPIDRPTENISSWPSIGKRKRLLPIQVHATPDTFENIIKTSFHLKSRLIGGGGF